MTLPSRSGARCPPIDELEKVLTAGTGSAELMQHVERCRKCQARTRRIRENISVLSGLVDVRDPRLAEAFAPGHTASGHIAVPGYDILEEMSRGGQGIVYKARQSATRRIVALKMLIHGQFASARQRNRFEREIELAAGLRHPNIVTIYESGTTHEGRHYCAMEFVEGVTLDEYMHSLRRRHGASPAATTAAVTAEFIKTALTLFVRICDAVNYAHQRGIIHRDLKPSNILIDTAGQPHVLDFGLAKALGSDLRSTVATTRTGEFMGTFAFAAPEQLRGDPEQIDTRTDVYSLGVMLYHAMTNSYPYDVSGSLSAVLRNITEAQPTVPHDLAPEIGDEISTIILKALGKERERRYQSAGAMAQDINRYLAGDPIEAKRDSHWYVLKKTARRYRATLVVSSAFILMIVVFGITMAVQARRIARERDRAVAADRASQTHAQLVAAALSESNIERGRAMGFAGNIPLAEDLLWQEFLYPHAPDVAASPHWHTRPDLASPHAYWALWELFASQPCTAALPGSPSGVAGLDISPDGSLLAGAGVDGKLRLWDIAGVPPRLLRTESGPRWGPVVFSPDGNAILAGGADGSIQFFDPRGSRPAHKISAFGTPTLCIAVTADSRRFVASGQGPDLVLGDAVSGRILETRPCEANGEIVVAINPEGSLAAVGSSRGELMLWSISPWRLLKRVQAHDAIVTRVAFSPDGAVIMSAARDNQLRSWDSRSLASMVTFTGHTAFVNNLAFLPDSTRVASCASDKTIMLWDARTAGLLATYAGHTDRVTSIRFSPDGRTLASASLDGVVRLWDSNPGRALLRRTNQSGSVFAVGWSPDQRIVATGGADGKLWLWDADTGALTSTLSAHAATIFAATFSPDGRMIATASEDRTVRLWDARTLHCVRTLEDLQWAVNWVTFSPDGSTIAACADMRPTRVWNVSTGECIRALDPRPQSRVPCAAFSPDGRSLAVCDQERDISVWDLTAGTRRTTLKGHTGQVRTLVYSPDGALLASAGDDWTIRLWNAETGERAGALEGHKNDIFAISFSRDGHLLASGSRGGNVKVWDPDTRRCLATLDSPSDMTFGTAFRPDGLRIAWCGKHTSLGLWDLTYYDRHIAACLEYQYLRCKSRLGESPVIGALREWAAAAMSRPPPSAPRSASPRNTS